MADTKVTQRGRLLAYYAKYNPEKLSTVDDALAKFAGSEDTVMWPTLIAKYGPEPPMDYRARLQRFYETHNPEKLSQLDVALNGFKGKEEEMFAALVKKYGPEPIPLPSSSQPASAAAPPPTAPASGSNYRSRLVAFYQKYNPDKLSSVDSTLTKFAGREEEMFEALVGKYGPEPGASTNVPTAAPAPAAAAPAGGDYRSRLIAFYQKYNPDKLSGVDSTLAKFAGREEEMFEALVGKYGPEPGATTAASVTAVTTAGPVGGDYRSRLIAFYQHYNPDKLSSVDATLVKFAGREAEMFDALVGKYGPEPGATTTVAAATFAPSGSDYRSRLVAFYQKYNPDKLSGVDATLSKFAGREEEMFEALVGKYGPEPGAATNAPAAVAPAPAAAAPAGGDYRSRLTAFYQKYNPDKLSSVDATLTKFAGREEEMFEALVGKYGPEPGASTNVPTPAASTGGDYRSRLIAFYEKYNPDKLNSVDATLAKFAGREEEMFQALVTKYGPEPNESSSAVDVKSRLVAFFQHYAPDKLATVDATLAKFAGREVELFEALVRKYGPEPSASPSPTSPTAPTAKSAPSDYRSRLIAFYQTYNPDKLNSVDATLTKFAGREEEMFEALVGKYGPEPGASTNVPTPAPSTGGDYRSRLIAFYEKYNPDKLNSVGATLAKFAGREDDMFQALVAKYGPEPVAAATVARLSTGGMSYRSRLIAFYEKYNPEKLSSVDATLTKFAGREDDMFQALVTKYGPEPHPAAPAPPSGASNHVARLVAFYEKYQPEKVHTVDATLQKFAGREEELWSALVAKYGPEPQPAAPATAIPLSAPLSKPPTPPATTTTSEAAVQPRAPTPTKAATPRLAPAPAPIQQLTPPSAKRPVTHHRISDVATAVKMEEEGRALLEHVEEDHRIVAVDHFTRAKRRIEQRLASASLAEQNDNALRARVFTFWMTQRAAIKEARKERKKLAYGAHIEKLKETLELTPYQRLALEKRTLQHVANERAGLGSPTSPRSRSKPTGVSPGRASILPGVVKNTAAVYDAAPTSPPLRRSNSTDAEPKSPSSWRAAPSASGSFRPPTSPLEALRKAESGSSFSKNKGAPAAVGNTKTITAAVEEYHADAIGAMSDLEKAKLARRLSKWNLAVPPSIATAAPPPPLRQASDIVSPRVQSNLPLRRSASSTVGRQPSSRSPTSGRRSKDDEEAYMAAVLYDSFARQP